MKQLGAINAIGSTAIVLVLAANLINPVGAQVSKDKQPFEDSSEVVEIQVPVTVVDNGEPVRGLTAADFRIFDDGNPRAISGFQAIDLKGMENANQRPGEARGLSSSARRHFLLLFDLSFSNTSAIARARDAARRFVLEQLHPSDLAAVATFSKELGPRLLVTFTPDRAQLARGIDILGQQRPGANADPLRFLIADLPPSSHPDATTGNSNAQGAIAEQQQALNRRFESTERHFERREITAWSAALGEMARKLDSIAGRKQVLYFSEGFDARLMLGRQPTGGGSESDTDRINIMTGQNWQVDTDEIYGNTRLQNDIHQMLQEFRRADCVIHAIDIGGLRAGADVRRNIGNRGQESLFIMADGTGGDLFDNANNLSHQLDLMLRRSEVTYILSFQARDLHLDGRYHRLKVKLVGRERASSRSRISSRAGYYAPRPYPELDPLEKQLLAGELIASAEPRKDIRIDLLATPFLTPTSAHTPVILEVSGHELLANHERERLSLEIFAYVTDSDGQVRDFFADAMVLDTSANPQAFKQGGLKYYGHLDLDLDEDYLLRVLVRDAESGRAGVETLTVYVPPSSSGALTPGAVHLLPPLFFDQPGRWVLVKEKPGVSRESVVYPFIVQGQPFIPSARPVLGPRRKVELCLMVYNLGERDPEVHGRVRDQDGNSLDGGRPDAARLVLAERTTTGIAGPDKLLATFNPRGLADGDYTLEVSLGREGPVSSLPFSVRK